ncbi:hypothetical protein Gogos_015335 [Gossypium gossypioides]|uniref:Pentatricopeptide repeat-containing protein n=1 Tax=Gossypium gossypioides TaxID=34282 RepID=A0A7J9C1A2_GOSGO|nr:hypothetical protein [Gossypium gossypioides]
MPASFSKTIDRPWFKEQPRGNVFGPNTRAAAPAITTISGGPRTYKALQTLLRCSQPKDSIFTFAYWVSKGLLVFDDFTYIFVLGACARSQSLSTLWLGRQVHVKAFKSGLMSNLLVKTTLIHFYANNKDILLARSVFDEMTERSSATWNAIIKGYTSQRERSKKCCREALVLFRDMLNDVSGQIPTDTTMVCVLSACSQLGEIYSGACVHGFIEKTIWVPESDVFIGTGLVDMYAKCGYIDSALSIFRLMSVKNVLTWTAMGTGLAVHGRGKEALELLDAMEDSGIKPNPVTFTSLFSACCHTGLVEEGLHLFHSMRSRFGLEPQIQHYGCIVDLLGRAGYLNEAYDFIIEMPIKPDAILWRSLLSACTVHGDLAMAEKVGKILLRLEPPKNSLHMPITSEDYIALSNVYASTGRWRQVEMDFIDGAEVVSMLECIQLSAGPLLALAAVPWLARVSPAPVVRAISAAISSMSRQSRKFCCVSRCGESWFPWGPNSADHRMSAVELKRLVSLITLVIRWHLVVECHSKGLVLHEKGVEPKSKVFFPSQSSWSFLSQSYLHWGKNESTI